jgi:hypothetical protein
MGRRGKRNRNKKSEPEPEQSQPTNSTADFQFIYKVRNTALKDGAPRPEAVDIFKIHEFKEEMGRALKRICKEYLKDFVHHKT